MLYYLDNIMGADNTFGEYNFNPEPYRIITNKPSTPHRCPVCNGSGLVPNGFYNHTGVYNYETTNTSPETCRTCMGLGIVWG